ncbi:hypothetical protein [Pyrobaculum neutrophilum]|uniref:Uncharacterized protein n=1 Tax=Pyrobaculum neutrophilum (strain DSM 2338 / JCM 9278 / NBRC 100436 / V24Sta) TaxID=444157 RepID=B1YBN7_PYRNV|nr:hypothetical protein [Pyrobaculum neutrophilum]ACB40839.1 hypothetical protein Tneu_1924 [Pyrobaculum neutrophilum V24Sta]
MRVAGAVVPLVILAALAAAAPFYIKVIDVSNRDPSYIPYDDIYTVNGCRFYIIVDKEGKMGVYELGRTPVVFDNSTGYGDAYQKYIKGTKQIEQYLRDRESFLKKLEELGAVEPKKISVDIEEINKTGRDAERSSRANSSIWQPAVEYEMRRGPVYAYIVADDPYDGVTITVSAPYAHVDEVWRFLGELPRAEFPVDVLVILYGEKRVTEEQVEVYRRAVIELEKELGTVREFRDFYGRVVAVEGLIHMPYDGYSLGFIIPIPDEHSFNISTARRIVTRLVQLAGMCHNNTVVKFVPRNMTGMTLLIPPTPPVAYAAAVAAGVVVTASALFILRRMRGRTR